LGRQRLAGPYLRWLARYRRVFQLTALLLGPILGPNNTPAERYGRI
jgi:hypothetical protein